MSLSVLFGLHPSMASARRIAKRFVRLGSSSADPIVSPATRRIFRRGLASVLSVKGGLSTMSQLQRAVPHCLLPILILAVLLVHQCVAELPIGIAVQSDPLPPQTLTTCRYDPSGLRPILRFAAAGDQIWDNGGACWRHYWVRCVGGNRPNACRSEHDLQWINRNPHHRHSHDHLHDKSGWINVTIVEQASRVGSPSSSNRATMMLSPTAYRAIANLPARSIRIEYERI